MIPSRDGVLALVLAAATTACGGSGDLVDSKAAEALSKEAEACKDEACLKSVEARMTTLAPGAGPNAKPTKHDLMLMANLSASISKTRATLKPATPSGASRRELFDAVVVACRETDAAKLAKVEAVAKTLGVTLPPPAPPSDNALMAKQNNVMRTMKIVETFTKAMTPPAYATKDLAAVSLAGDTCMTWIAYHPDDPMIATYTGMIEKHAKFAELDPSITKPLLDAIAKNPATLDEAAGAFVAAVDKAL